MTRTYKTSYRDDQGELSTVIDNDGRNLRVRLGTVAFSGRDFDGLDVVGSPKAAELARFTFASGSLCACSFDFEVPIRVLTSPVEEPATLRVQITLGPPKPTGGIVAETVRLDLAVGDKHFVSRGVSGWFEDELLDIERALPDGWRLKICFGCAYSDYSPAGHGAFGDLACFRDNKSGYLSVKTKADFWRVLEKGADPVQETHLCPEFEVRKPGTGYRG